MGLIRILIIAICILYVIKALAKILMPFLFKKVASKMQNNMDAQNQAKHKPEGTISVDYIPPNAKKQPKVKDNNDFIAYEEVK
ncbi:MAG: DUF4834 domain-containing protein [Sphingobacteriales bacterium]|nr:MAG: DUF4834 domain-containing protein [Sphingobacteriales bacterium]TAF81898.1 MAG: DUF4834 domain-containing protein [Sphingobacteriales bacterium]